MEPIFLNMDRKELIQTLQSLLDKAPSELKESVPNLLLISSQLLDAVALHDTVSPVNNVLHYLDAGRICPPDTAQCLLKQANNNTGIASQTESLINFMTSHDEVPYAVKQCILDSMKSTANTLIITSAICAGVQLVVSLASLWHLHESIRDASNVAKGSKETLTLVSGKLKSIAKRMSELDNALMELNQQGISILQVTRFSNKANRVKVQIDSQLRSCMCDIASLEFEIQSKKVKLGDIRQNTYMAGVSSAVHGLTSAFNVISLAGTADPIVLGVSGTLAAVNLLLGVICPARAFFSIKDLDELSNRLVEIRKIKANGEDLEMKLRSQAETLYDRIDELSMAYEN